MTPFRTELLKVELKLQKRKVQQIKEAYNNLRAIEDTDPEIAGDALDNLMERDTVARVQIHVITRLLSIEGADDPKEAKNRAVRAVAGTSVSILRDMQKKRLLPDWLWDRALMQKNKDGQPT